MLEKYYKERINYKDYLLLFKYGSFYETFDVDAYIVSKIFGYKLIKLKDTFRCGFPINKLSYVFDKLCDLSINFIVIDSNVSKRDFVNNKYNEYIVNDDVRYNIESIHRIITYLNSNMFNTNINYKLISIEGILNER